MKTFELFYLAGKVLALDEHPEFKEEIIHTFHNNNIVERFILLCSNQLILPLQYLKFKQHDLLSLFSKEVIEHLAYIYELNVERNKQILKQIDEINFELQKEKIEPIYLKGTGNLLDGLYSDFGERMIGDIDVLVKEIDFLKTAEIVKD